MSVDQYGDTNGAGQYKTVAQIWQQATEQGSNYRILSAKHRYNIVKNASGDDFIPETDLKKVKSVGHGTFASGAVDPIDKTERSPSGQCCWPLAAPNQPDIQHAWPVQLIFVSIKEAWSPSSTLRPLPTQKVKNSLKALHEKRVCCAQYSTG